jgi:hypothetical protein
VRLHLGPVSTREIEQLLEERGLADAPEAARLARLADGVPGLAMAYALRPEAERIRAELALGLVDLLGVGRRDRLSGARGLLARAGELLAALDAGSSSTAGAGAAQGAATGSKRRTKGARSNEELAPAAVAAVAVAEASGDGDGGAADADGDAPAAGAPGKPAASDRRRAALELIGVWRAVARDLALLARTAETGRAEARALLHEPDLLEDLERAADGLDAATPARFLERLDEAGRLIESNVNPELTLDVLALAWHRAA